MIRRRDVFSLNKYKSGLAKLFLVASRSPSVVVMAPMFTEENGKDGYIQRIRSIDELVLKDRIRFYIMGDHPELDQIVVKKIDNDHYYLEFNSENLEHMQYINSLAFRCGTLYVHSVYRFMAGPVSHMMQGILDVTNIRIFWDVHGAVPEECVLNGDPGIAKVAGSVEEKLFQKSDVIICVNEAMKNHLKDKYFKATNASFVILPIIGNIQHGAIYATSPNNKKPVVIYSGGLQAWQNVEEMLRIAIETKERYEYRFFVADPKALVEKAGRENLDGISIRSVGPDQIGKEYVGCNYGLLLRDDIAVNRVACPTKLIEYVENRIVPVLKSKKIGDFEKLGLNCVLEQDLLDGRLPDENIRFEMAEKNLLCLESIKEQQNRGIEEIIRTLKQ